MTLPEAIFFGIIIYSAAGIFCKMLDVLGDK